MDAPEDRSKALNEHVSFGFAPRADIVAACRHVRFVPQGADAAMTCANTRLFDDLVGALLEKERHVKAERLGGLEIDHKLELDRSLDGKLTRRLALEDAIDIRGRLTKLIEPVTSIRQQATEFGEETKRIDSRETVASSQRGDLLAMAAHEAIRHHDQASIRLARLCGNDGFELGRVVDRCGDRLHS